MLIAQLRILRLLLLPVLLLSGATLQVAFRSWAHLDSNQGPGGYEPPALTAELWAQPRARFREQRRAQSTPANRGCRAMGPGEMRRWPAVIRRGARRPAPAPPPPG